MRPDKRQPPPKKRREQRAQDGGIWGVLLTPLATRKNVGEWKKVRSYDSPGAAASAAYEIRENKRPGIPAGDWDATARFGDLWVCYLGEGPQ